MSNSLDFGIWFAFSSWMLCIGLILCLLGWYIFDSVILVGLGFILAFIFREEDPFRKGGVLAPASWFSKPNLYILIGFEHQLWAMNYQKVLMQCMLSNITLCNVQSIGRKF